jgi:outer membrane protein insertion porin family
MKATDRFAGTARRLAILVAFLVGGSSALAQPPAGKVIVADVIPVGNHQMPTQRITGILKTRPGNEYSQSTVDEDVRTLYQTNAFRTVEARWQDAGNGRVVVYFMLTEHPNRIEEIRYEGARHISKEDLESTTGLRIGQPLSPTANQVAARAIERKFVQEKGYLFARVDLVEGDKPNDKRVVFRITEGSTVKISSIEFTGVEFVTPQRIRTQVQSSSAIIGIGGEYNPLMVESDVGKLVEYYKTFGFHDVRVSRELQWEKDLSRVKLVFHIEEGRRYRLGTMQIDGPPGTPIDQLSTLMLGTEGEWYDNNKVKANSTLFKDFDGYRGKDAIVKTNLDYQGNGVVNVNYEVTERQPATVGQVIIVGNKTTRQNVILRQVPLYPGQLLTYPDLRVAEANLARLNIFEMDQEKGIHPTVEVLDPDGPNPVKDILINVNETRTGSLMFGLGVNSDAGLTGSVVLNERNFDITRIPTSWDDLLSGSAFRGAGQEFRVEAVPGQYIQRYTTSWREPFLFDSPWSLSLSGYYYQALYNEYEEARTGFRATLGRRIFDYWQISETVRVEGVGVDNVTFGAPPQISDYQGRHFLIGGKTTLTRDTRDSFLRPTSGNHFEVSGEYVGGDYAFPVLNLEDDQYFTLYQRADNSGKWVLALRSQTSWAGDEAPVYERFYAGGYHSMRGFEFRGVGPDVNGFKVGGDFMTLNSAEVQIPILPNDALYGVAFLDTGTVESKVDLKNYRVAAGFGLRIVVPMLGPVPIALDFGFPLHQAPTDNKQVFSFWLGFFN